MKPIYLFTGLLAWTSLVVTSCSTPKMAQSVNIQDDVYNSTTTAVAYERPAPSAAARYQDSISTNDYGSSDPNYDMDYYSRINRFYYGGPFRSYYDPYFDPYFDGFYGAGLYSPFYSGFSFGLGLNYGWGNYWGPYSYGGLYSPFWGYRVWPYGGYMGGGYYGGGFLGGGYYGGGFLVGNGNVTRGGRPSRGRENGIDYNNGSTRINNGMGSRGTRSTSGGGVVLGGRSDRPATYNPNRGATLSTRPGGSGGAVGRPARTTSGREGNQRPTRTESYTPDRSSRPTYTPAPSSGGGSRSSGSMGGGGGGASRPTRGGGRG